jgi:hypothetical protein
MDLDIFDDFLKIFNNNEIKDFDFIIKNILYEDTSIWILKQYNINNNLINKYNIIENNIIELLSKLTIKNTIEYIIIKLIPTFNKFKKIELDLGIIYLKVFFKNIKNNIYERIVKNILYKNDYSNELINTFYDINSLINNNLKLEHEILDTVIIKFNNITLRYIQNKNIINKYNIYLINNIVFNTIFKKNLTCINIVLNNIIHYVENNQNIFIDIKILYIINDIINNYIPSYNIKYNKNELVNIIENYAIKLYINITDLTILNNNLLKEIIKIFDFISKFKKMEDNINYPIIIKTNINNIIKNDNILKYFIFGLSKIIMNSIYNDKIIEITNNIISLIKYINNIDIVLQYYYESLKIRINHYLINKINTENFLNIEEIMIQHLELFNFEKLKISHDIFNLIDNLKYSILLKESMNIDENIFIDNNLKLEKYNINIPEIFIKNINIINDNYLELFSINNRKLELSLLDSVVKLSINNITITGSLLPMSILYYYGYCENIDIFKIMFNNENEELMNNTLKILKYNNLLINEKINIPLENIILNENKINNNKIIERIQYDRDIITKCYIMKTAKILKSNIDKENLFKLTQEKIKYFNLNYDLFERILNFCTEKELLTINNSGLLEY